MECDWPWISQNREQQERTLDFWILVLFFFFCVFPSIQPSVRVLSLSLSLDILSILVYVILYPSISTESLQKDVTTPGVNYTIKKKKISRAVRQKKTFYIISWMQHTPFGGVQRQKWNVLVVNHSNTYFINHNQIKHCADTNVFWGRRTHDTGPLVLVVWPYRPRIGQNVIFVRRRRRTKLIKTLVFTTINSDSAAVVALDGVQDLFEPLIIEHINYRRDGQRHVVFNSK